jgi:hemolysin D
VVQSRRAALDAGEATLLGLERRRDIAMVKERNAAPHVDVAITRFQYLQLKDDLTSLDKDIESQRQTNSKLRFYIQESSRKLAQVTSEYQNAILGDISDRTTMIMQLQAESDRAKKFLQDDIIRAPVDGYIQYIAVSTIGASVAPADQLMLIVPKDSPLIVEAFLSNEDRGFVRLGQDVDIKIDAFPFQKYGKLSGTLTWLSSDAEDYASATRRSPSPFAPSLASGTQRSQFVYRMRIQPRNLQLLDRSIVLSPGLSVKADIYTDKRRIIDFLLFPVQEGIETATRTR